MVDDNIKVVGINEKHLLIISSAIDFAHPNLQNYGIELSDNLANLDQALIDSIDEKFWGENSQFRLTVDEIKFARKALIKYRDFLNYQKATAKKGSAEYKKIHNTLKEIPKILTGFLVNLDDIETTF